MLDDRRLRCSYPDQAQSNAELLTRHPIVCTRGIRTPEERARRRPRRVRTVLVLIPTAPLPGEHKAEGSPSGHYSLGIRAVLSVVLCCSAARRLATAPTRCRGCRRSSRAPSTALAPRCVVARRARAPRRYPSTSSRSPRIWSRGAWVRFVVC